MKQEENDENKKEEIISTESVTKDSNLKSIAGFSEALEPPTKPKKKSCSFPTAYSILLIIELIVFILTYIIPKGLYDKISYSSEEKLFTIKSYNGTITRHNATQEFLDELQVKIPLDSFIKGYLIDPISIPNTYHPIDEDMTNPLKVITYPIKGCFDSAYIAYFLMVMGGNLNILIEMNALSAGMAALSRVTKGREFLLLILVFIIIAIGGTTFGMAEEILPFYPILMPIFLKSGFDGILAASPLFMGAMIGNMFSTVNTFCVVLASYSAGINFINGIVYRIILFVFGNTIAILYLYIYYRKIRADETSSVVYDVKDEIEKIYLKKNENSEEEFLKKKQNESKERKSKDVNAQNDEKYVVEIEENLIAQNKEKFSIKQKISIILFILGFVVMIAGILVLDWWFEHMASIFMVLGIILMFFYNQGERKGLESFLRGAGDFVGVTLVIGIARGINLTLNEGKISDTILNKLSIAVEGLPAMAFAVILFIIFIFLGIFIQSSSGLAILSMPVFAPLADKVGLPRATVVNTYMFGEYLVSFVTPTGLILIMLSLVQIEYSYWVKFIWPFLVILFVFLILFVMISVYVD